MIDHRRNPRKAHGVARHAGERGQTTAEYALVILGAAALGLMLLAWATDTGAVSILMDRVLDTVLDMIN